MCKSCKLGIANTDYIEMKGLNKWRTVSCSHII